MNGINLFLQRLQVLQQSNPVFSFRVPKRCDYKRLG